MCLNISSTSKRPKPLISDEEIKIFKVFVYDSVSKKLFTPLQKFLVKENIENLEKVVSFEMKYDKSLKVRKGGFLGYGYRIEEGIHSFLGYDFNSRILENFVYYCKPNSLIEGIVEHILESGGFSKKEYVVFEGYIPSGTPYFIGDNKEVVSNRIVLNKFLKKI